MEISTLIVDDEPAARRRLRLLLADDPAIKIIGECGDGVSAAEMIRNSRPRLVFLDVQIPGSDGFDVLREVADCDELPAIVFVTAHREYAIPAFEAQALDYLLKPFKRARFVEVLARAKAHIVRNAEHQQRSASAEAPRLLLIKSNGRMFFHKMSELKWVIAERDYLQLYLDDSQHFIRETMNNFQRRLDKNGFVRIHRSTIVNVDQISEVIPLAGGDATVVLRDRTELTLSRRYRAAFDDFLRLRLTSADSATKAR
jgi:two-component system, LytTR family, response regulator